MIAGIGTDIVQIERIRKSMERCGERFLEKILTESERAQMPDKNEKRRAEWVAGRFACKEACVKALGTGFSGGIAPEHIEILRDGGKAPVMRLLGKAKEKADSLGVVRWHVSYAHEQDNAVAFVVLEKLPQ